MHTNCIDKITKIIPNGKVVLERLSINVINAEPVKETPNGKKFNHIAHICDYYKLTTMYKYGGLWMDFDMIILGSLEEASK